MVDTLFGEFLASVCEGGCILRGARRLPRSKRVLVLGRPEDAADLFLAEDASLDLIILRYAPETPEEEWCLTATS